MKVPYKVQGKVAIMARQRMVTRTIRAYTAHCMTVDTKTATVGTADLTFTGTKPANIEKALAQHSTDTLKYVAVQSYRMLK